MSATLVVLAAGLGSRYGGSKQLEPVGPSGEALMDYSIYDALLAGFTRVILVTRPETRTELAAHVARWAGRVDVIIAEQRTDSARSRPFGTGHALLCAREHIDGPFAVVNADDYYGPDAFYQVAGALSAPGERDERKRVRGWLVTYRLAETLSPNGGVSRAVCTASSTGLLERIVEVSEVAAHAGRITGRTRSGQESFDGTEAASMNLWAFEPEALDLLQQSFDEFLARSPGDAEEFRIPDAVMAWLAQDAAVVQVLPTDARWFGLTFPADLAHTRHAIAALVETHAYPRRLTEPPVTGETSGGRAQ